MYEYRFTVQYCVYEYIVQSKCSYYFILYTKKYRYLSKEVMYRTRYTIVIELCIKLKLKLEPESELDQSDGSGSSQIPRLRNPAYHTVGISWHMAYC